MKLYANIFMDMARMLHKVDFRHPECSEDVPLLSYQDVDIFFRMLHSPSVCSLKGEFSQDSTIEENKVFSCPIFVPAGLSAHNSKTRKNQRALILLHGLNERHWEKYLPWAHHLCRTTGRTVILFPIAYHMNRAPGFWGNVRSMMPLMNLRKSSSKHNSAVSFANAALSQRIDEKPERFIAGALQTMNDVEQLVSTIRRGKDLLVADTASIHFFSYSIGCSLAEMLLMVDEDRHKADKLFSESRVCLFCGGSIMEYANPVSRAILDEDAFNRLNHYFENFGDVNLKGDMLLDLKVKAFVFGVNSATGSNIFSILSSLMKTRFVPESRNRYLLAIKNRFRGFMLSTDKVFPASGLRRTWKGANGKALISVNEYIGVPGSSHEVPFPLSRDEEENKVVDAGFYQIFSDVVNFLESPSPLL